MNILEARRRTLGKGVYKKTVEGNPAIAQGSLARMYPGITMQGWTNQNQYEGNQLLDASVFNGVEKSGVSVSVDNGVITASGMSETSIWIQSANFSEEDFKKLKSGNIYVKNYKSSDCNYECGIYINNIAVNEGNSPHPIPDGYLETKPNNVCFFIDIRAGIELKGSCKPMIYQDGDGTWEPYTGGQPSPNPDYPQEIVSAGKYDEASRKYQYTIKISDSEESPTKSQTVTLTSDRPLTKWDRLEKRNGVWGWLYKSAEYTMTGEEIFYVASESYIGELTSDSYINVNNLQEINGYYGFSNYLKIYVDVWGGNFDGVEGFSYNGTQIHVRISNEDTGVVAEDTMGKVRDKIKAYCAQRYADGTPFIFWHETSEETFTPLSESEQEQMNTLYTFRPTTVLSNDCECEMTLTYKTKKSLQPVSGGGIRKSSGVTSYFTFGVKWNQINKIVLKASGITEGQNIFFCGEGAKQPWIGLYANKALVFLGIRNGTCNLTSDDILDGQFHEMIFEFDISNSDFNIVNVWDSAWSKNIIYHEIAFYNGDELLADYVPYYKGAGYMLDKKNNVVIRATNPDDYEFA